MIEQRLASIRELQRRAGRPLRFMEVCGTHTMAAFRTGLRALLPPEVTLLSGPGCPVCVTDDSYIDAAIALAGLPDTRVATFGDMMRVPGTESSLERARAGGAQVRVVYSPLDALQEAQENPQRRVVFLGVGFETTAPTVAWTLRAAAEAGLANYSVLCAHKTMPQAMAALLAGGQVRIDGFLCPGHVSAVIGADAYAFIARDHGIPCVVAGFEAADMAEGIEMLARQIVEKRAEVEVQYRRAVDRAGNPLARAAIEEVFEPDDAPWRGIGVIPGSGLRIRSRFAAHDAARLFSPLDLPRPRAHSGCRCGDVLRGAITPPQCPLFARRCTPEAPVGPCMVSSEGACAAWFRYAGPSSTPSQGPARP
jgi:hydrogenase expression/formation protein HypD